jgi:hypothetical protein
MSIAYLTTPLGREQLRLLPRREVAALVAPREAIRRRRRCLHGHDFAAAVAACSISRATTSGCEMNATWLALTSLVLAFIRFA